MKTTDLVDLKNVGVLLFKEEWLDDITRLSGKLAKSNEYQVHYWALVLRKVFKDNSILDVAIPTVIFNYPQDVSSAHIDFIGADMIAMSDSLEEVAKTISEELLSKLPSKFLDLGFSPLTVSKMTLHRHP